jgi:hypothetical protein
VCVCVCARLYACAKRARCVNLQEVGFVHMRVADGVGTLLQITGLCARLCELSARDRAARAKAGR